MFHAQRTIISFHLKTLELNDNNLNLTKTSPNKVVGKIYTNIRRKNCNIVPGSLLN